MTLRLLGVGIGRRLRARRVFRRLDEQSSGHFVVNDGAGHDHHVSNDGAGHDNCASNHGACDDDRTSNDSATAF
jgi:hypothetical protein